MLNVNMQKSLVPQNAPGAEVTELESEVKKETPRSSPTIEDKPRKRSFGEVDGGVEVDHAQGKRLALGRTSQALEEPLIKAWNEEVVFMNMTYFESFAIILS